MRVYLVSVDHGVDVVPFLDLDDAEDVIDAQLLQPFDWQRRWKCR